MAQGKMTIGRRIAGAIAAIRGKAAADLTPSGGWDTLVGTLAYRNADEIWQSLNDAERLAVYRNSGIVYACVNKIASSFQEARLTVARTLPGGEKKEIPNHPMLDVLRNPNALMGLRQYQQTVISHLLLTGISYTLEDRNKGNQIVELWPIPKTDVRARKTVTDQTVFEIKAPGKRDWTPRPLVDLTTVYFPDPAKPESPIAPLAAASRDTQTDDERANWLIEVLRNMHLPGLILRQPEEWTTDAMDYARRRLRDMVGPGKRGDALFLSGEGTNAQILEPPTDLDLHGMANLSESRICAVLGVPPMTIGLRVGLEKATYTNFPEANGAFFRQTMVAYWIIVADGFSKGFLWNEGEPEDVGFYYDTSDVKELQDDATETSARASTLFHGGIVTRNRAREIVGEDPLSPEFGDVLAMPINLMEVPITPAAIKAADARADDDDDDETTAHETQFGGGSGDGDGDDDGDAEGDDGADGKTRRRVLRAS